MEILISVSRPAVAVLNYNVTDVGVNAAFSREQLNAKCEPYLHISDGESKHLVHILIAAPVELRSLYHR